MNENAVMPMPPKPHSRVQLVLLWAGVVASDCAAQLLFKSAALQLDAPRLDPGWVAMVAQSVRVWSAAACLFLTFGLWMLILRRSSLSSAFPITSLTIVGVIVGSRLVFEEAISPLHYAGIALIVTGVALLRPDREDAVEEGPSISS